MEKLPEKRRSTTEMTLNALRLLRLLIIRKIYEKIASVLYLVEDVYYRGLELNDNILYVSIRFFLVSRIFYIRRKADFLDSLSKKRDQLIDITWIILMISGVLLLREKQKNQFLFELEEKRLLIINLQIDEDLYKLDKLKLLPRFWDATTVNGTQLTKAVKVYDKYGLLKPVTYISDVEYERDEIKLMFRNLQMEEELKKFNLLNFVPRFFSANIDDTHFTPMFKMVNKSAIWNSITFINNFENMKNNFKFEEGDINIRFLVNIDELREKHQRPAYDEESFYDYEYDYEYDKEEDEYDDDKEEDEYKYYYNYYYSEEEDDDL